MSNETSTRTVKIQQKLASVFEPAQVEVLSEVVSEAFQDLVKTSDFSELKAVVGELAQAQQRTEQRVEELAQAQQRTEQRVEELAQAQQSLAQAQQRTEQRVEELAQAQQRTEQRVEELAQAQGRTETSLDILTKTVGQLARQVGGLSDMVGGDVEDIAQFMVAQVLQNELGWRVNALERRWQTWGTKPEEIDLFGQALDPSQPEAKIVIIGEAKVNLTYKEAQKFRSQVKRAQAHFSETVFPLCFCYRARPEVQDFLQENQIHLVFSYGKLILNNTGQG